MTHPFFIIPFYYYLLFLDIYTPGKICFTFVTPLLKNFRQSPSIEAGIKLFYL